MAYTNGIYVLRYTWCVSLNIIRIMLYNVNTWIQDALARGVSVVSFGHPIADVGLPNTSMFLCINAMGLKGIGHPIHPKFVFLDTQF